MAYTLSVFHKGETSPTETRLANDAPSAFKIIQALLADYADCQRIAVYDVSQFLFAVDCHGERIVEGD